VFHVFAALAEFIRELIVQGTHEGLAAGRARGERIGRPPAMTEEQVRHAARGFEGVAPLIRPSHPAVGRPGIPPAPASGTATAVRWPARDTRADGAATADGHVAVSDGPSGPVSVLNGGPVSGRL
jgi:hypothetical protein